VVDRTGVGGAVVDLLTEAHLSPIAVTITGGDKVHRDSKTRYSVPKRELVGCLQVLLQTGRLKIASALPESEILVKELLNFQVKITASAHDTYGAWREGAHDDLVLAVALACWYGEQGGRR
jgi:CxxC motif-containing protein